jgi:uncharacterized membrane protein
MLNIRLNNVKDWLSNNISFKFGKLTLYLILLLSFTSIDYLLNVRWINSMNNYTIISGSILFPLFGLIFFFIPTFYLHLTNKLDMTENNKVSRKDMIAIASFDGLNALLATIPIPYLSIVIMSIVDKVNLPLVALASFIFLGRRYYPSHYLGIFLTLYGILVSFIPNFMEHDISLHIGWMFIYMSSIIPGTASYVYKEKKLKEVNVSVWWMNSWICLYQLFIGFLFLPITILSSHTLTFSNFPKHMSDAFKCQFAGINSNPGDECQDAFLWFMLFNFISTFSNILMFLIIQEGSAVLFIIIRTLKTPITSYLASFPQLAGISASPVTVADWYAFVMLIVASLVYYYKDERDKYGHPITNTNDEIEPILIQDNDSENSNFVLDVDDATPLSLHSQFSTLYNHIDENEKNVAL